MNIRPTLMLSIRNIYRNASDEKLGFVNPWANYKKYGNVMLSGNRGRGKMEYIMVFDELSESIFTSPEKPDLATMMTSE